MNATVQFVSGPNHAEPPNGVLVPPNALHGDTGSEYVLVVSDQHAIARKVRVLARRPDALVVEGLTGGVDLIVNAPATVKDGSRIRAASQGTAR